VWHGLFRQRDGRLRRPLAARSVFFVCFVTFVFFVVKFWLRVLCGLWIKRDRLRLL